MCNSITTRSNRILFRFKVENIFSAIYNLHLNKYSAKVKSYEIIHLQFHADLFCLILLIYIFSTGIYFPKGINLIGLFDIQINKSWIFWHEMFIYTLHTYRALEAIAAYHIGLEVKIDIGKLSEGNFQWKRRVDISF